MNDKIPKPKDNGNFAQGPIAREAWRLFGIMSEFVEATERMNQIRPAASLFGSVRVPAGHPYYVLAERIARRHGPRPGHRRAAGGGGCDIQARAAASRRCQRNASRF